MKIFYYITAYFATSILLSACGTKNSESVTPLPISREESSISTHDRFTSSVLDFAPSSHVSVESKLGTSSSEASSESKLSYLPPSSNAPVSSSAATPSSSTAATSSKVTVVMEQMPVQEKISFIPDRSNPIETPEQLAKNQQLRDYMIELRAALTPEEYAYISLDYVAFQIGIYTPQPDRVKSLVSEHPNKLIFVHIFPESFSRQDVSDIVDEIYELPFVKSNLNKVSRIGASNSIDRYGKISIQLLKAIPELEEWVKTADYGPIEIVFKGHEKFVE